MKRFGDERWMDWQAFEKLLFPGDGDWLTRQHSTIVEVLTRHDYVLRRIHTGENGVRWSVEYRLADGVTPESARMLAGLLVSG